MLFFVFFVADNSQATCSVLSVIKPDFKIKKQVKFSVYDRNVGVIEFENRDQNFSAETGQLEEKYENKKINSIKNNIDKNNANNSIVRSNTNKSIVIMRNTGNNEVINTTNTAVVEINATTNGGTKTLNKDKNPFELPNNNIKMDPRTDLTNKTNKENEAKLNDKIELNDKNKTNKEVIELTEEISTNKNVNLESEIEKNNQQTDKANENDIKKLEDESKIRQVISTKVINSSRYKKDTINLNDYENMNSKIYDKLEDDEGRYKVVPKMRIIKSSNYSKEDSNPTNNLKIINKIEQNLMYSDKDDLKSKVKIDVKKGEWTKDDLVETKKVNRFKVKKTSKKITAESERDEVEATIAKLKDLAYEATKMREYEIAVKLYKKVLKLNSNDNFAKLSLATSYHMLGQYVQAKPIYIELLPIFPNSEQLASNLLSIIIQESPYEAIYLLPALAAKYNTSAKIQAQTSVAFTSVERYDTAIQYIQKAINLDEGNYEYKYNLAVLYDLTKRYSQAYTLYKELYDVSGVEKSLPSRKIKERLTQLKKYI